MIFNYDNMSELNWKKYENTGDEYYYLPQWLSKIKIYDIDQVPSRENVTVLENDLNKLDANDIYPINSSCFAARYGERDKSDLVKIPFGCYKFEYSNGNRPDRLEKMDIRNDIYFANQKLLEQIQDDITKFLSADQVFKDLSIIKKRGYLLYGLPGTGKTSFVRHLVSEVLPKECHVIWLDSTPNNIFMRFLNEISTLKVFVVEEITAFNEDNSIREVLEFLDGESSPKNSIIIGTTNYPDQLKQNMADRPSRFDVVIEVPEPSEKEAKMFFESFLKRKLIDDEVILTGLSVSHIKEICLLSLMHKLSLQECYDKVKDKRSNFKNGFSNRNPVGIQRDHDRGSSPR